MDSPELIPPSFLPRHTMSLTKDIPEDSGYVTVTPSSVESTGICNDMSSGLSLCRMELSYISVSRPSITPGCETSTYDPSPMKLLSKTDVNLNSGVSFLDDSPNIFSSTRVFPSAQLGSLSHTGETASMSHKSSRRKLINRQDAMDWSPSDSSKSPSKMISTYKVDSSKNDRYAKAKTSMYPTESTDQKIKRISSFKMELTPLQTDITDKSYCDSSIHRTPKKYGVSKTSIVIKAQRPIKRMTFPIQSIGTPEKNKLLYSELKSVTPQKRSKPFEKSRFSPEKENSPLPYESAVRNLYWKSDYCGFDRVDFIKLFSNGYNGINEKILGFLFGKDIFNASQVNPTWKSECLNEKVLCKRVMDYEETSKNNKENLTTKDSLTNFSKSNKKKLYHKNNSVELMDIQNIQNIMLDTRPTTQKSPSVSPRSKKFHRFTKAASQSTADRLRSCPLCEMPAKLSGRWAVCEGLSCNFTFCVYCYNDKRHCQSSSCPNTIKAASPSKDSPIKTNTTFEKRRKNLRRLLF